MKPKFVLVLIVYIAAIGAMAWYSRQRAVDFARQEQRRQEELGAGYTPSGPRLQAMSGIFNANPNGDPEAQAQGIAIAASQELSQRLVERLQAAMAEQGPVGAVNVCGDVAQQMTTDYNRERGVQVRRVALRNRNPLNLPDAFERPFLESAAGSTEEEPVSAYGEFVESDAVSEYRYLSPIYLKPLCITCHGAPEQIPAEVLEVIQERYPDDRATGFALGEFRGAISVRVPFASAEGESAGE